MAWGRGRYRPPAFRGRKGPFCANGSVAYPSGRARLSRRLRNALTLRAPCAHNRDKNPYDRKVFKIPFRQCGLLKFFPPGWPAGKSPGQGHRLHGQKLPRQKLPRHKVTKFPASGVNKAPRHQVPDFRSQQVTLELCSGVNA